MIITNEGFTGIPRWRGGEASSYQCRRLGFNPWVRKIPWKRKWQPIPIFLPGKSHGQRSLVGKEPDMTEHTYMHAQKGFINNKLVCCPSKALRFFIQRISRAVWDRSIQECHMPGKLMSDRCSMSQNPHIRTQRLTCPPSRHKGNAHDDLIKIVQSSLYTFLLFWCISINSHLFVLKNAIHIF